MFMGRVAILGVLVVTIPVRGEEPAEAPARFEFVQTHMGSEFKIVLYSPDAPTASRASDAAFRRIAALDASFSDYEPESELMRLCEKAGGPPVPVNADLFDILQRSRAMYDRSDGAFDVTVGPVVRLWRRARRDRKMPESRVLERARSLVSSERLTLDGATHAVRLQRAGMKLDLGGIAKGYASSAALVELRKHGITRALVAGAGDIALGDPPPDRQGWVVGVAPLDNPSRVPDLHLSLHNACVSTSGDAERFVEIDGRRYSHIVDPRTGLGVVDRAEVTVVAPEGATADALATAVFVLGWEKGLRLVEATPGASARIERKSGTGNEISESTRFRSLPRAVPQPRDPAAANPPVGERPLTTPRPPG